MDPDSVHKTLEGLTVRARVQPPHQLSSLPRPSRQPSTWRFAPLIYPAASEARNTHGQATSRPVPKRLRAVACMARCWRAGVGHKTALTPSVSIGPGKCS
jgi:hypothetical protein